MAWNAATRDASKLNRVRSLCALALTAMLPNLSWAQGYGHMPVLTPEMLADITNAACVKTGSNLMKMTAMAKAARLPETARGDGALISWKLPGLLTISAMSDGACQVTIDDHSIEWLDDILTRGNANVLIDEEQRGDTHLKRFAFRSAALPADDDIRIMEVIRTFDELADTLAVSLPGEARQAEFRTKGMFDAARRRLDLKASFTIDAAQTAFARYCLETGGDPVLMHERITSDGGTENPGKPGAPGKAWTLADRADIGISGNSCALAALNEQPAVKSHSFGSGVQSLTVSVMGRADMPQRIVYATLTSTPAEPEGRLTPVMVSSSGRNLQFLTMPDKGPAFVKGWSDTELREQLGALTDKKSQQK